MYYTVNDHHIRLNTSSKQENGNDIKFSRLFTEKVNPDNLVNFYNSPNQVPGCYLPMKIIKM